jgi:cell filamentation protein
MASPSDNDPYVDPASGVLLNLAGIRDAMALERFEAEMSVMRQMELSRHHLGSDFDLSHLKAIHRHLFQDVYGWAGETRTVDIVKGGSRFGSYHFIRSYLESVFSQLAEERRTWSRFVGNAGLPERLAEYLGEINAVHPFREGNGRTQRVFIGELAAAHGLVIRWDRMTPGEMLEASIASFGGNNALLKDLIQRSSNEEP